MICNAWIEIFFLLAGCVIGYGIALIFRVYPTDEEREARVISICEQIGPYIIKTYADKIFAEMLAKHNKIEDK